MGGASPFFSLYYSRAYILYLYNIGGASPFFSLYYSIENIYCFTKNLFLKKNYVERCKKDVRKFVNTFNLRYLCKQ